MDQQSEDGQQEGHGEILGGAEDAQLGGERFDDGERGSGGDELDQQRGDGDEDSGGGVLAVGGDAPGQEQREADAGVVEELERGGPLDQREVARGVLKQHGFMDHGELEVGGGIVDGDARVLGQQHHGERYGGEDDRGIDDGGMRAVAVDERWQGRASKEQEGVEQDHQQGG